MKSILPFFAVLVGSHTFGFLEHLNKISRIRDATVPADKINRLAGKA